MHQRTSEMEGGNPQSEGVETLPPRSQHFTLNKASWVAQRCPPPHCPLRALEAQRTQLPNRPVFTLMPFFGTSKGDWVQWTVGSCVVSLWPISSQARSLERPRGQVSGGGGRSGVFEREKPYLSPGGGGADVRGITNS